MTDENVEPNREGESETSTTLFERLRAKQPAAWDRLVDLYGPVVYGWCRHWGLQPCDAENLGQETFLKVAQHLGDFRRDRPDDTFRGWLYRIARNGFLDRMRKEGREIAIDGGDSTAERALDERAARESSNDGEPSDCDQEQSMSDEAAQLYARALELIRDEFSERDWEACQGLLNGLPAQTVAAGLGVTANVVYLAKSRILRRLRDEFADLLPDATG